MFIPIRIFRERFSDYAHGRCINLACGAGGTMWAASAAVIGYCSKKVREDADDQKTALMAVNLCERTIVIYERAITADGPTLELLQDETLLTLSGLEKPLSMQACPVCGKSNRNLKIRIQSTT